MKANRLTSNDKNPFNQDISKWHISNVTDLSFMFFGCNFNQSINYNSFNHYWNTKNVKNMESMFSWSAFNQSINYWNTSNVTSMNSMFLFNFNFNQPINTEINPTNTWNTRNVKNMSRMFYATNSFFQNIKKWNTSNVTDMSEMFRGADSFYSAIELWTVGSSTNLDNMFVNATQMDTSNAGITYYGDTPDYRYFNQSSPYCVSEGTIVTTDQGEVKIEELNKNYTINGNKILGVSKDFYLREEMVLIKKDAISENIPNEDLYITPNHQLTYKGKFVKAKWLVNNLENVEFVKNDKGISVYNILLEKYTIYKANNLELKFKHKQSK